MTEHIAICSMFNNSIARGDLACYIGQIETLDYPSDDISIYAVEGDSSDGTYEALQRWARIDRRVHVSKLDMGALPMGSIENDARFLQGNRVGSYARWSALKDNPDRVLWIESDLIWYPDLLARLGTAWPGFDLVAPWVIAQTNGTGTRALCELERTRDLSFYDVWAFRHLADQRRFTHNEPRPTAPFQVHSAGSCLMVKAYVAAESNTPNARAIVGWCEQAAARGYSTWCDPRVVVWHQAPRPEL